MNERTMKLRLGAAVVLCIVIIIIFLTFLGSREKFAVSSYHIKIQMVDAPNVVENTPIYQSGILIGRVSKVELTDTKGVIVTARIYDKHKLYHDQECHLASTLLGDASLRMVTRPKDDSNQFPHTEIKPGEVIQGQTSLDPTLLVAKMQEKLTVAIDDVTLASEKLTAVASTTNEMLVENRENVREIVANARSITGNSAKIVSSFSTILDDEFCTNLQTSVANLREASEKLPGTLDKVDSTLESMQSTIQLSNSTITNMTKKMENSLSGVDKMVVTLNSTLSNIEKITQPFADEDLTNKWISNVTNVLRNMDVFTETLNRRDSTLGLLMTDRQMFDRMQTTMERISELPRKLEPILFNAQVMTEKLAQHPELLGLRGYLKKDSGTSMSIPWPKGGSSYSSAGAYGSYGSSSYGSGSYGSGSYGSYGTRPGTNSGSVNSMSSGSMAVAPPSGMRSAASPAAIPGNQTQVLPAPASASANSMALKRAEPRQNAGSSARRNPNARISPNAQEVTPEMLGMTPEEFRNSDFQILSDAALDASAPSAETQGTASGSVALPPALPPIVAKPMPVNPPTGLKAAIRE